MMSGILIDFILAFLKIVKIDFQFLNLVTGM